MERKFLEGLGITDKNTIDSILDQNGAETGALNARLKQAKTELDTARTDLTAANTKLAGMKDIETLQTELANEKAGRLADKKDWNLRSLLTANGCEDVDYLVYKSNADVTYEDNGDVKDAESLISTLKEKFKNFFKTDDAGTGADAGTGKAAGTGSIGNFCKDHGVKVPVKKNPYTQEGWNLTLQCQLELTDPEKAKKLRAEAEALA